MISSLKGIKVFKEDISKASEAIIIHQVNCMGVMGSGVALDLKNNFPLNFLKYKEKCDSKNVTKENLGETLFCYEKDKIIANIFSQDGYGRDKNVCYTDYPSLQKGLTLVANEAKRLNVSIAVPFIIGCGSANGDKDKVFLMLRNTFKDLDWSFYLGKNSTIDLENFKL